MFEAQLTVAGSSKDLIVLLCLGSAQCDVCTASGWTACIASRQAGCYSTSDWAWWLSLRCNWAKAMQLMYVGENLRKAQFLTAHTCSRQTGAPKPLRSTSCICSDSINLPVHDHSHMPAMPCGCSIESCLQTICHGLWHNDLCEMLQGARKLQASTHNNMPWASWKETTLTWASHECLARIYQGALVNNTRQPCWG